jgi:hypothetical protein
MRKTICKKVLLVSVCLVAATALAQQSQEPAHFYTDLSVTYAPERSEIVPGKCCFWMQGGGADAAVTFWKGFGVAAAFTGDHASAIAHGVDLNKIAYMGGPRYTYTAWTSHSGASATPRFQIFGQGLFGGVHGFGGAYPTTSSTTPSANAFLLQAGGGFNYFFTKNLALRALEVDYVRTQLPNDASNSQNDLRLAFGVTYHFGSVAPPR